MIVKYVFSKKKEDDHYRYVDSTVQPLNKYFLPTYYNNTIKTDPEKYELWKK